MANSGPFWSSRVGPEWIWVTKVEICRCRGGGLTDMGRPPDYTEVGLRIGAGGGGLDPPSFVPQCRHFNIGPKTGPPFLRVAPKLDPSCLL